MAKTMTRQLNDELILELVTNRKKWGVQNPELITDCVVDIVYFALSRAIGGRENKLISTSLSQIESFTKTTPSKPGMFSGIKSFLRPSRQQ